MLPKDLSQLIAHLECAGVDNPKRDLMLLLAFIQKRSYTDVFFDSALSFEHYNRLLPLIHRRCQGEPLSKIIGQREFWSLPFKVTADTLDPRPDSETSIDAMLTYFPDCHQTLKMIDFGTGTGCLLLSALSEYPNSWGVGVDISHTALAVAQQNATNLGLSNRAFFIHGTWAEGFQGKFDILISNPPYIGLSEPLEPAVKQFDPPLALYGGEDGLEAYRGLLPQLPALMHSQSLAFIELGQGQGGAVRSIAKEAGLICVKAHSDLAGIERVIVLRAEIK